MKLRSAEKVKLVGVLRCCKGSVKLSSGATPGGPRLSIVILLFCNRDSHASGRHDPSKMVDSASQML